MKKAVAGLGVAALLVMFGPVADARQRHPRRPPPRCRYHEDCGGRDDGGGKQTCFALCNDVIVIPDPVPGGKVAS